MAKKDLSNLNNEELLKTEKQLKIVIYTVLGLVTILLAFGIYSMFTPKKIIFLLIIPGGLSPIFFANEKELKKIKAEKIRRNI